MCTSLICLPLTAQPIDLRYRHLAGLDLADAGQGKDEHAVYICHTWLQYNPLWLDLPKGSIHSLTFYKIICGLLF